MTTQSTSSGIGAGQQVPEDANSEYTVAAFIVRQMMAELETMLPVQVMAAHPGQGTPPQAGTVDVQLLVSLLDGSGNSTQQGIVYGLPYFRLQGGKWAIICDPDVKDFGYIISASRDISNVVKSPGVANPASYRKYSFSDGIYIGGCLNAVPSNWVWCKSDGTLVIQGNLEVTGAIIAGSGGADSVTLQGHLHTSAASGDPTSGPTPGT